MPSHKGQPYSFTKDDLIERVRVWEENGRSVSATARAVGRGRSAVKHSLDRAAEFGLIEERDLENPNVPIRMDYIAARDRKAAEYDRKKKKGDWRKPVLITIPHSVFMLKIFGDPHIDAESFNMMLFEKHWLDMDMSRGIYGMCVGDFFNNWTKALAHLYQDQANPSDAWMVFEYLMAERSGSLIAACSGNHDDWSKVPAAEAEPIGRIMRENGVRYRKGAIRLLLDTPAGPYTVAMRHKWRGASMYSAAHGIKRGVEKGWFDDASIGGHIHQDEIRHHVNPETGQITQLVQLSTFKEIDDHVDIQGHQGPRIQPVLNMVVNTHRKQTDPDRSKVIWDTESAIDWMESERRRYG